MRALERYLLLQIIDNKWREHLYDMDYLREGIHLRGFAQIDPLVAYKNEAYELFTDLMNSIWADFARMIFHVEVEVEGADGAGDPTGRRAAGAAARSSTPAASAPSSPARCRPRRPRAASSTRPRRSRPPAQRRGRLRTPPRSSSSAASTSTTPSGATTRAGAAAARSTRSATAPSAAWRPRQTHPSRSASPPSRRASTLLREGTDPDALAASIASLEQQMQATGLLG